MKLLEEIRGCSFCSEYLPLGPNPIIRAAANSKIILISQAPGSIAHKSGIPWDDPGGNRLRDWLGVTKEEFYKEENFAIVPMGFCYPGKGKGGDLPPRPECSIIWHDKVFSQFKNVKLKILIGQYAQQSYLKDYFKKNLTETVLNFESFLPEYFPLPHPSPRNRFWMTKNPWFEDSILPTLKILVREILDSRPN
ncbi:Uracil-DNA glycosylase [Flavobacteriaceae bacterium MAR_2010_188]|nr:Uracil-DNA glycosylase [Flavobacteriaceae bacterium MAR_2010_188]